MSKLSEVQLRRLRIITTQIERLYGAGNGYAPSFIFRLFYGDGWVMLSADNIDGTRWFDTVYRCNVVIGERGGIKQYVGNMRPKLLLPATPRNCEYENPHPTRRTKE